MEWKKGGRSAKVILNIVCSMDVIRENVGVEMEGGLRGEEREKPVRNGPEVLSSKMWEEAMKIARREGLTWMTSIASVNLADVHSMDGKTRLALDHLRKARKVMKETGDLEGLSAVDFNMALVQIDKGNLSLAEKYFKRSRSFPLTYEKKLAEREKAYNERLEMRREYSTFFLIKHSGEVVTSWAIIISGISIENFSWN